MHGNLIIDNVYISCFFESSAISLNLCNNVNAVCCDVEAGSLFHFLKIFHFLKKKMWRRRESRLCRFTGPSAKCNKFWNWRKMSTRFFWTKWTLETERYIISVFHPIRLFILIEARKRNLGQLKIRLLEGQVFFFADERSTSGSLAT